MGADLYLESVREHFRNSYNSGDVMWAMGLSWPGTVGNLLDSESYLPVESARELLAMIEARPLSKERLAQHYFDHITKGVEHHPISGLIIRTLREDKNVVLPASSPPDFSCIAAFLQQRRSELIVLLNNSIALDEPLLCWL